MGETLTISATVVLVCAILCGALLYGCSERNRHYHERVLKCIEQGGSWVSQWNDEGACVARAAKQ